MAPTQDRLAELRARYERPADEPAPIHVRLSETPLSQHAPGVDRAVLDAQTQLAALTQELEQVVQSALRALNRKPPLSQRAKAWWYRQRAAQAKLLTLNQSRNDALSRALGEAADRMAQLLNRMRACAKETKERLMASQLEQRAALQRAEHDQMEKMQAILTERRGAQLAQKELRAFTRELKEISDTIERYEDDIDLARTLTEHDRADQLTEELREVMHLKAELLSGRLQIADLAQSAQAALAEHASAHRATHAAAERARVLLEAQRCVCDVMGRLEAQYQEAQLQLLPAFTAQSQLAAMGQDLSASSDQLTRAMEALKKNQRSAARLCKDATALQSGASMRALLNSARAFDPLL